MDAQMIAVKNNVVYDATMSPNIGFELVVGERKTTQVSDLDFEVEFIA